MDGTFFISLLLAIWLGIVTFFLVRILRTFSRLTKGISEKDIRQLLEEVLTNISTQAKVSSQLKAEIEHLKIEGLTHIQKIGLIRYNPFSETGGNQSFVLAILDGEGNGLVMTSLHSREATRVFAKPVKQGKESGYEFSKEEIQAVVTAQKSERVKL